MSGVVTVGLRVAVCMAFVPSVMFSFNTVSDSLLVDLESDGSYQGSRVFHRTNSGTKDVVD